MTKPAEQSESERHPRLAGSMSERFVTFGSVVRGYRLGYGYSHKHGCFIRIDAQGPPWLITLAPNGGIPSRFIGSNEHVVWWESDETRAVLDEIKPLAMVRGVKRVVQFHVDYAGERV